MNGVDYDYEDELTPQPEKKGWPWWVFLVVGLSFWSILVLGSVFALIFMEAGL